jgi:hypothetical protein
MITLSADRLHWISDDGSDEPSDLCAHSPVTCQIDDQVIAQPEDGDWTVSASAIFLLRALGRDHTKESKVGDQIFPCCGHGIFDVGEPEVVICGCPSGIDFEIRHTDTTFQLSTEDGRVIDVPKYDWRNAVLRYSDQVMEFYDQSAPKEPSDEEDRKGFAAMMSEWRRLRQEHTKAEQVSGGNDGQRR